MLVTTNPQRTLWETVLPPGYQDLPAQLASVDALLDDPVFFEPYRCGAGVVAELNEALLGKAHDAKVVKTGQVRTDTTVVPADVTYPTDSGLLVRAVTLIVGLAAKIHGLGAVSRTPDAEDLRRTQPRQQHQARDGAVPAGAEAAYQRLHLRRVQAVLLGILQYEPPKSSTEAAKRTGPTDSGAGSLAGAVHDLVGGSDLVVHR